VSERVHIGCIREYKDECDRAVAVPCIIVDESSSEVLVRD
jgi:hypothetical protein